MMNMSLAPRGLIGLALLLLTGSLAFAQITGDLEVRASDSSGAAIAAAKVSLKHIETGQVRAGVTDAAGAIRFTLLNIGRYEVRVENPGFETVVTQAEVNSGAIREVRATLAVSSTRQEVVVEESPVAINTVTAQLQTNTSAKQLTELPVFQNNPLSLVGNTPGALPVAARNPFLGAGSFSMNGGRGRGNNITIDNATATDVSTTGSAGIGTVPLDIIKEVSLITNNFSAEFGRNANSQFQILTKSGTNELHGRLFHFFQNDKLNARDYFDRTGKASILRDNYFGAVLGGPIVRNKLFAIGHWDQQVRRGAGGTRVASSWTPAQVASITDPTSRRLFEQLGGPAFTSPSGTVASAAPLTTDNVGGSIRVDWNISDKSTLFGRWAIFDTVNNSASLTFLGSNFPTAGASSVNRNQTGTISYTRTFSPTIVYNLLASFGRSRPSFPALASFGGPNLRFSDGTAALGIATNLPQGRTQNTYQLLNTVTISRGRHLLKGGYEVNRIHMNSFFDSLFRGRFTYPSFAAFAAGQPSQYEQNFGGSVRGYRVWNHFAYFQDDWRVSPTLTLNLGVRFEAPLGVTEVNDIVSNLDLNQTGPLGGAGAGPLGGLRVGGKAYNNSYNWGPRLGFAWNPNQGKLAIRGGYGVAYDFIYTNPITNLRFLPPFVYSSQLVTAQITGADSYSALAGGNSAFHQANRAAIGTFGTNIQNFGRLTVVDRGLKNPQVQQWNLTLEREVWKGWLARGSYVGTKNNFLQRTRPINLIQPGLFTPPTTLAEEAAFISSGRANALFQGLTGTLTSRSNRVDPRFNALPLVESSASSNYHSLQVYLAKRFRGGSGVTVAYTLGKSIDDISDALGVLVSDGSFQQDPRNNRDNRAVSSFDVPQRIAITHNYEFPFFKNSGSPLLKRTLGGWALNGVFQAQSGVPVNLFSGVRTTARAITDPILLGGETTTNGPRPNLTGSLNLKFLPDPGSGANNPNLITNSNLSQPLLGQFGNLGRNVIRQNGLTQYDLNIMKNIPVTERVNMQFQAQMFNLLNNTSFSRPGQLLSGPANFGYYQDTDTNSRAMTFILRVIF